MNLFLLSFVIRLLALVINCVNAFVIGKQVIYGSVNALVIGNQLVLYCNSGIVRFCIV